MTRIASSLLHLQAQWTLKQAQNAMYTAQAQMGSETKSSELKGYGVQAETLVSTRALMSRLDTRIDVTRGLVSRLEVQDTALEEIQGAATDFRAALTDALSLDEGGQLMAKVESAFARTITALNTKFAGKSVFGGVKDNDAPVAVSTLNDLAALPALADAFENATTTVKAQLDGGEPTDLAPLADGVASELLAAFRDLKQFADGPNGPFDGPLSPAQRAEIEARIGDLQTALDTVIEATAINGVAQNRADTALRNAEAERLTLNSVVDGIQSVDMAEVATRLQQAQLQYQASATIYNQLKDLSLVNFLR